MFEFRIERNRPVRTGTYTQLTVETTADIVDVAFQHSFLLALVVGHGLRFDTYRSVGTIHLTNSAGYALVFVVFVVRHDQLATETVEHLQRGPIFGILFGGLLAEENTQRNTHAFQQREQPFEKRPDLFFKSTHIPIYLLYVTAVKNAIRLRR